MDYRFAPWRSPIIWSSLLGLSLTLGGCGKKPMAQGQMPMAVSVKLETLQEKILRTETEYVGVLEANQLVTLKPEIDGIVQAILAQEGDIVQAGMPILRLKSDRDQASVQQAIANVEAAKASTVNTQAQLSATKAEKAEATADLKLREQDLVRIRELVETGALADRELDQSERDVSVAKARVETLTQRIAAAEASINQAKANLNQNQSALAIATEDLREAIVTAPISGILGDLSIKPGDYLEQADTIGTITQNQNLNLDFFVPIEQAPQLRLGLPIELIDYRSLEVIGQGQVSFIAPEVDFTSQSILAKASFDNPDSRLFTGQLVKAKVIWQQQLGLSVPVTAVSRIGGETFIFVAQPNPEPEGENPPPFVARQKPVTLGKIDGDRYQVIKGLTKGEKIITTGILNLNDGVPVSPADAAPQP